MSNLPKAKCVITAELLNIEGAAVPSVRYRVRVQLETHTAGRTGTYAECRAYAIDKCRDHRVEPVIFG